MANPWFRLYSEFADDPKVQMMPEAMQRRLIMLFCARCKSETLHETHLAFHWRISNSELAETKALFIDSGFIDERWNLLNWNERQFLSDSSTGRVRRHRQTLKQNETLQETAETFQAVTVTAPEQIQIQSRTDAEQIDTLSANILEADRLIFEAYPKHRRVALRKACAAILAATKRLVAGENDLPAMEQREARKFLWDKTSQYAKSPAGNAGRYTPHPATWFNASRYLDAPLTWQSGGNGDGSKGEEKNGRADHRAQRNEEELREIVSRLASEPINDHAGNLSNRKLHQGGQGGLVA